jgi:hypothetical protein
LSNCCNFSPSSSSFMCAPRGVGMLNCMMYHCESSFSYSAAPPSCSPTSKLA